MTQEEVEAGAMALRQLPSLEREIQILQDFLNGRGDKSFSMTIGLSREVNIDSPEVTPDERQAIVQAIENGYAPVPVYNSEIPVYPNTPDAKTVATTVLSVYLRQRSESNAIINRLGEENIRRGEELVKNISDTKKRLAVCEKIRSSHSMWNGIVFVLVSETGEALDNSIPIEVSAEEQFALIEPIKENLSKSLAYYEMELRRL